MRIQRDDLLDLVDYEKQRPELRSQAMQARRARRVHVGPMITVAFENFDTVRYQIHEMMRAERMVHDEAIQFEIDTYSEMLPGTNELSATLFIEIDNPTLLREWLPRLIGIEESVVIHIEDAGSVRAEGEPGRSKEDVTSTVHYLRFSLSQDQAKAILADKPLRLSVELSAYSHTADVSTETRQALAQDLQQVAS